MKIKVLCNHRLVGMPELEVRPGYVFTYDAACADYDWLVVFDELPDGDAGTFHDGYEPLACPRERTMLLTWEPVSVKDYSRAYALQFGHLLTNRPFEAERHPHYHLGRGYFPWFYGKSEAEIARAVLPEKSKTVSAVCSAKKMRHTQHYARFHLMEELAKSVPGLEWWGHGVRDFSNKYDLLDPYRYHIAVENHVAPFHWSEKLADSILGECLTFYAGDPEIGAVLPPEAIVPIPIDDPAEAARIINSAIAADEYAKRREAVLEAKRLILGRYNFNDQIIAVVEGAKDLPVTPVDAAHPVRLYARKALRRRSVRAMGEAILGHIRRGLGVKR